MDITARKRAIQAKLPRSYHTSDTIFSGINNKTAGTSSMWKTYEQSYAATTAATVGLGLLLKNATLPTKLLFCSLDV